MSNWFTNAVSSAWGGSQGVANYGSQTGGYFGGAADPAQIVGTTDAGFRMAPVDLATGRPTAAGGRPYATDLYMGPGTVSGGISSLLRLNPFSSSYEDATPIGSAPQTPDAVDVAQAGTEFATPSASDGGTLLSDSWLHPTKPELPAFDASMSPEQQRWEVGNYQDKMQQYEASLRGPAAAAMNGLKQIYDRSYRPVVDAVGDFVSAAPERTISALTYLGIVTKQIGERLSTDRSPQTTSGPDDASPALPDAPSAAPQAESQPSAAAGGLGPLASGTSSGDAPAPAGPAEGSRARLRLRPGDDPFADLQKRVDDYNLTLAAEVTAGKLAPETAVAASRNTEDRLMLMYEMQAKREGDAQKAVAKLTAERAIRVGGAVGASAKLNYGLAASVLEKKPKDIMAKRAALDSLAASIAADMDALSNPDLSAEVKSFYAAQISGNAAIFEQEKADMLSMGVRGGFLGLKKGTAGTGANEFDWLAVGQALALASPFLVLAIEQSIASDREKRLMKFQMDMREQDRSHDIEMLTLRGQQQLALQEEANKGSGGSTGASSNISLGGAFSG